jgi:S1-C subfamily serine protease
MNRLERLTIALIIGGVLSMGWSLYTATMHGPPGQGRRPLPPQTTPTPPPVTAEPQRPAPAPAPPFLPDLPSVVVDIPERTGVVTGTAFAVDSAGTWLTARHVAGQCGEIGVQTPGGWVLAQADYLHPQADLAVIKTIGGPPALNRATQPLLLGQDGFSFGFPEGTPGAVHGKLMGRSRMRMSDQMHGIAAVTTWAEQRRLPETIETLSGLSGGPLLNSDGEVIGIVVAASIRRGRVMAIAPETIEELALTHVIPDPNPLARFGISAEQLDQIGIALRERLIVVKVLCR